MNAVQRITQIVTGDIPANWLPVGFRAVAVIPLLIAGSTKVLDHGSQAARFTELGVPMADVMVVLVGILELATACSLAIGVASRLAGLVAAQIMLAAIWFAGVVPSNAIVLLACFGIVVLGPGHYTAWNAETKVLEQQS